MTWLETVIQNSSSWEGGECYCKYMMQEFDAFIKYASEFPNSQIFYEGDICKYREY